MSTNGVAVWVELELSTLDLRHGARESRLKRMLSTGSGNDHCPGAHYQEDPHASRYRASGRRPEILTGGLTSPARLCRPSGTLAKTGFITRRKLLWNLIESEKEADLCEPLRRDSEPIPAVVIESVADVRK
ncbi:MAG: hypothetical protein ACKO2P_04540 [Planctomycetota bacterium]